MQSKIINCCKIFFVCFVVVSCGKSKEDEKLFVELNLALESSNKIIEGKSTDYLEELKLKKEDMKTKEIASIWESKAKNVQKLSNELIVYLDLLQIQTSEGRTLDATEIKTLYTNLITYKRKVLQIDERIAADIGMVISLTNNKKDSTEITESIFNTSFDKLNSSIILAILKNRIVTIKEMLIEYCSFNAKPGCLLHFESFQAIASQNSTKFKPAETLQITAGVGAFSTAASPKIFVNDKEIQLNSDGVAEYKTKVPNEIGTYKKQVKIEYIKPDGTRGSVEKEIIYTVDE